MKKKYLVLFLALSLLPISGFAEDSKKEKEREFYNPSKFSGKESDKIPYADLSIEEKQAANLIAMNNKKSYPKGAHNKWARHSKLQKEKIKNSKKAWPRFEKWFSQLTN